MTSACCFLLATLASATPSPRLEQALRDATAHQARAVTADLRLEAPWWVLTLGLDGKFTQVSSTSEESVLRSVAPLVDELLEGTPAALERKDLAERLGTDEAGVAALRRYSAEHPDLPLVDAWTELLATHNRAPSWRAPLVGTTLFTGGLAVLALSGVCGVLGMLMTTRALPGLQAHRFLGNPAEAGTVSSEFPILFAVLWDASFLPPLLAGGAALAAARLSMEIARGPQPVRVSAGGGCRDERKLARTLSPTTAESAAPYLAALGGMAGILGTVGYLAAAAVTWPFLSLFSARLPSVSLAAGQVLPALAVASAVFMVGYWLATVPFGAAAMAASVWMMFHRTPSPMGE